MTDDDKPPPRPRHIILPKAEALRRRIRLAFNLVYALVACIFIGGLVQGAVPSTAPRPGDMQSLNNAGTGYGSSLAPITAYLAAGPWAPPGAACVLDETVMKTPGGTLTVLAVRPDGVMLIWAGGATAQQHSCPTGPFLVSLPDYAALARSTAPHQQLSGR